MLHLPSGLYIFAALASLYAKDDYAILTLPVLAW
nr:MAG TPA: hypothetical protein [Caudoviricetes sp.]